MRLLLLVMDEAVYAGIGWGILLCIGGFLLSLNATSRVEEWLLSRHQRPGVAGYYAGALVRMTVAVVGIIAVYFLLGKNHAVPCALVMVPLSFLEVMGCMAVHLRRIRHAEQRAGDRTQPQSPGGSPNTME